MWMSAAAQRSARSLIRRELALAIVRISVFAPVSRATSRGPCACLSRIRPQGEGSGD